MEVLARNNMNYLGYVESLKRGKMGEHNILRRMICKITRSDVLSVR